MTVYNHLLFSEIFFQHIRRETSDLENLRVTLGTIRDTWRYYLPPPEGHTGPAWMPEEHLDETDVLQLRACVVEQIFGYLELTYGPCETDSRAFFLYGDWAKSAPTGLCLVLPYAEDIEGRQEKKGIIPKGCNHAQQLLRLLREHDLDWGVLTNGRHWRLLHRAELSPTETYLHIDLEQIIATGDIENYIVFHRFFSRPAFVREGNRQRLDVYKEQSDQAAQMIEKHLSAHVEEIVRKLCQGLVESCRDAGEQASAPATRKEIYKNALYLVYRLLFVLYAEARDLLPLDTPAYREVCLRDILAQVQRNHREGLNAGDDYTLWRRLQDLFALIDQGKPGAGVPAYNGGLFDPGRRPFLIQHRIRNDYLQEALIRLCTMPGKRLSYDQDRDPTPIDYRDLSVRHLGSLYEGLLEYNLFVVGGEPRVVRGSGKRTAYVPFSKAGKVRAGETVLPVGDVYFSETEGERKATGSYYTPEDVVDYIVGQTVGKKLAELKRNFYAEHDIERQLADLADTPADIPAHGQIQRALDELYLRFVHEKVLTLKILDPTMGSGHFSVNATHVVANFIVEMLNETPWTNLEIDTDVATWKRQVAERCIFGVDLNELAVELAKLCLWMTTAAKGKPLTFLDHHLRWGNSLVGAWLKDVGLYPRRKHESTQAFTLPLEQFRVDAGEVLSAYAALYAKNSDDVAEVREKARIFDQEIYPRLQPYRELLTLHTAVYFGEGPDEAMYARLGAAVNEAAAWTALKTLNALAPQLQDLEARRWFHWELEFPEVFSGERRGFDIVVGNPPYVRQERISDHKPYFQAAFADTYHGGADLYVYFIDRGTHLLNDMGLMGFITANKWLRADYAASLRESLPKMAHPIELLDFGSSDIFVGAVTFPCILILAGVGSAPKPLRFADVSDQARGTISLPTYASSVAFDVPVENLQPDGWLLEPPAVSDLLRRLQTEFTHLGELPGIDALRGIITGLNDAFYVDTATRDQLIATDPACEPLVRSLLRGRNIQRWVPAWGGEWMIAISSGANRIWPWSECENDRDAEVIFRRTYPALHAHLKLFESRLRRRQDQGRFWWELRSCDYYDALDKPKIVVQQILSHSVFALDVSDHWVNQTVYCLPTDDLYLLAVLNSRVAWWYLSRTLPHKVGEALSVQKPGLLSLPIPTAPSNLCARIEVLVQQALAHVRAGEPVPLSLEEDINAAVMEAYGLSATEEALIARTLPLRDPLAVAAKRGQ